MTLDTASSRILDRRPWLSQPGMFSYGFTRATSDHVEDDAEIGERLIAAYRRAIADRPRNPRFADMWTGIVSTWYGELVALVDKGDPVALTSYLRALPRQSAGHGYFQGRVAFDVLAASNEQRRRALCLMDYLAGMAEAVGVLPVRCQEQTGWETFSGGSAQELRSAIEKKIGISISLPPVFDGLFTLEPETGPIHLRSLMAVYAMLQLSTLLQHQSGVAGNADFHCAAIACLRAGRGQWRLSPCAAGSQLDSRWLCRGNVAGLRVTMLFLGATRLAVSLGSTRHLGGTSSLSWF